MTLNKCPHDDSIPYEYLPCLGSVGEVYLCECGALIDVSDKKNYDFPMEPMTAGDIKAMIIRLEMDIRDAIFEAVKSAVRP